MQRGEKKQVDPRIIALINNGVKANHRSFFVMVGDRGRDQIVFLHQFLSQARTTRPNVLWCYKKDLGFTTWVSSLCKIRKLPLLTLEQPPEKGREEDQARGQAGQTGRQRPHAV